MSGHSYLTLSGRAGMRHSRSNRNDQTERMFSGLHIQRTILGPPYGARHAGALNRIRSGFTNFSQIEAHEHATE